MLCKCYWCYDINFVSYRCSFSRKSLDSSKNLSPENRLSERARRLTLSRHKFLASGPSCPSSDRHIQWIWPDHCREDRAYVGFEHKIQLTVRCLWMDAEGRAWCHGAGEWELSPLYCANFQTCWLVRICFDCVCGRHGEISRSCVILLLFSLFCSFFFWGIQIMYITILNWASARAYRKLQKRP
jgi:hypothetical protein